MISRVLETAATNTEFESCSLVAAEVIGKVAVTRVGVGFGWTVLSKALSRL